MSRRRTSGHRGHGGTAVPPGELRGEPLHPPVDGHVIDGDAAPGQQLPGVPVGQAVPQVPADRAASLPGAGEIRALEASALARPRETMTPAEIRAMAAEAIAHLNEVADNLAELSALLADESAGGASHDHA